MKNLLYYIAIVLIIIWAIGFLAYSVGVFIHILLAVAVVAVLLKMIKGRKPPDNAKNSENDQRLKSQETSIHQG